MTSISDERDGGQRPATIERAMYGAFGAASRPSRSSGPPPRGRSGESGVREGRRAWGNDYRTYGNTEERSYGNGYRCPKFVPRGRPAPGAGDEADAPRRAVRGILFGAAGSLVIYGLAAGLLLVF